MDPHVPSPQEEQVPASGRKLKWVLACTIAAAAAWFMWPSTPEQRPISPPHTEKRLAPAIQQTLSPRVAPKKAPIANSDCRRVLYRHAKIRSHQDGEACARHKNFLPLNSNEARHTCVRVNGTPVAFTRRPGGLVIDSVAGPQAQIEILYCRKSQTCYGSCQIPKKRSILKTLGVRRAKKERQDALENELTSFAGEFAKVQQKQVTLFKGWQVTRTDSACQLKVSAR